MVHICTHEAEAQLGSKYIRDLAYCSVYSGSSGKSALAEHAWMNHHPIQWEEVSVIDQDCQGVASEGGHPHPVFSWLLWSEHQMASPLGAGRVECVAKAILLILWLYPPHQSPPWSEQLVSAPLGTLPLWLSSGHWESAPSSVALEEQHRVAVAVEWCAVPCSKRNSTVWQHPAPNSAGVGVSQTAFGEKCMKIWKSGWNGLPNV